MRLMTSATEEPDSLRPAMSAAVVGVELPGTDVAAVAAGTAGAVDAGERVAGECCVHGSCATADDSDQLRDGATASVPVAGAAHGALRRGCRPVISAIRVISSPL